MFQTWRTPKRKLVVALAGLRAGYDCKSCKRSGLCEVRGCLPGTKAATPYVIDGEEIWKCPLTFIDSEVSQSLSIWAGYKKGFLPDDGSYLDQSNRFVEYMEFLDANQSKYEREEFDRKSKMRKR